MNGLCVEIIRILFTPQVFSLISFLNCLTFFMCMCAARGDRMKQAATDADELIATYRLEQQDAFDKAANSSGKSIPLQYILPM